MSSEADQKVLRKKAGASPAAVGPTAMDVQKAMRFAAAKSGDSVLSVPVGVRAVSDSLLMPDDLEEGLPPDAMLLRLNDEGGSIGMAAIGLQAVAAVIEASTLGTVLAGETAERPPTRTDAMLVSAYLDAFLAGFGMIIAEVQRPPPVAGYRCTDPFADLRAAQLVLADAAHIRYDITFDFGLGAKVAPIVIVLPKERAAAAQAMPEDEWTEALEKVVLSSAAEIQAILGRITLPLEQASNLTIGDVIPLEELSLDRVHLLDMTGKRAALGRLGRAGQNRAVRVNLVEEEEADGGAAPPMLQEFAAPQPLPEPEPMGMPMAEPMALEAPMEAPQDALGMIEPMSIPASEANFG